LGLDNASVKFLCAAKSMGVDFARTATIGRQELFADADVLDKVFKTLGIDHDPGKFLQQNRYGEAFFEALGAKQVTSLDVSAFEEATILHDMNTPIPDSLRGRFSVVHDGGLIEHVFHVTQALKNCMEMVEVGGHFTQVNVCNNYSGHGFWQFSPEMIFRALSPANGYRIAVVLLHEVMSAGEWYAVSDPAVMNGRVELCNSVPTCILTVARRITDTEVFSIPPQQSDYVRLWDGPPAEPRSIPDWSCSTNLPFTLLGWRRFVPNTVKRIGRGALDCQPCYEIQYAIVRSHEKS
jgi:hypothetical protein